jgi:hypothetical protein
MVIVREHGYGVAGLRIHVQLRADAVGPAVVVLRKDLLVTSSFMIRLPPHLTADQRRER